MKIDKFFIVLLSNDDDDLVMAFIEIIRYVCDGLCLDMRLLCFEFCLVFD